MNRFILLTIGLFLSVLGRTQIIFLEEFDSGIPSYWVSYDEDSNTPDSSVIEFENGWITYEDGATGDTCAASTSFFDPAGQADVWLVLDSLITLENFTKLSWDVKSVDASYPDNYEVYVSTSGNTPADFGSPIYTSQDEPPYWQRRTVHLDTIGFSGGEQVYLAFRHTTNDGYILLIDDVMIDGGVSEINDPEPLHLSVYPNPTENILRISGVDAGQITQWEIYNLQGQILLNGNQVEIDVENLQTGSYLLRIQTNAGIQTIPFNRL